MSNTVIKVENLSKQYRLGQVGTGSLAHDMNRVWHRMLGKEDPYLKIGEANDRTQKGNSEYVWAIKDLNFEVNHGEVLGIIGRNGAGKSTLLKILSRTTYPTTGSVKIKGRVASLLEVGTGFHPELSGRENIFLNGAILGMTKREIKAKFDEIVDFAGVERYIDTPVKRYSSGMYVRLAFGVAAHLEPEILIVDEVLAVGDAEFQKKALGKMKDVSNKEGRTVLFVSHNMQAISTLTQKCLYLINGTLFKQGDTNEIIDAYLKNSNENPGFYRSNERLNHINTPRVIGVNVVTSDEGNVHIHGRAFKVEFLIYTPFNVSKAALSFQIFDNMQRPYLDNWLYYTTNPDFLATPGVYKVVCTFPKLQLYMGTYYIMVHLGEFGKQKYETIDEICKFEVTMYGQIREYEWQPNACAYIQESSWEISKIEGVS